MRSLLVEISHPLKPPHKAKWVDAMTRRAAYWRC